MINLPIRKTLFRDIDPDLVDEDKNARLVIERVFSFGNLDELQTIWRYYGEEKIKNHIVNARSLDEKTLSFASVLLDLPKENFRCYTPKRPGKLRWR